MSDCPTEYKIHTSSATQPPANQICTCISQPRTFSHFLPTFPPPPHVGNLPSPHCSGPCRISSGVGIHSRNKWTAHCLPIHPCFNCAAPKIMLNMYSYNYVSIVVRQFVPTVPTVHRCNLDLYTRSPLNQNVLFCRAASP